MKSENEVTEAHDILVAVILGEVDGLRVSPDVLAHLNTAASTLCWVLGHDHNRTFEDNLRQLRQQIAAKGYILHKGRQPGIN